MLNVNTGCWILDTGYWMLVNLCDDMMENMKWSIGVLFQRNSFGGVMEKWKITPSPISNFTSPNSTNKLINQYTGKYDQCFHHISPDVFRKLSNKLCILPHQLKDRAIFYRAAVFLIVLIYSFYQFGIFP